MFYNFGVEFAAPGETQQCTKCGGKARAAATSARTKVQNREKLREYLAGQLCVDCGLGDVWVLEFDHRQPLEKRNDVSSLIGHAFSWRTIL
jgi:hypothetical protein